MDVLSLVGEPDDSAVLPYLGIVAVWLFCLVPLTIIVKDQGWYDRYIDRLPAPVQWTLAVIAIVFAPIVLGGALIAAGSKPADEPAERRHVEVSRPLF